MALNIKNQLSNSEGLMEVIVFEGLSHSVVVHPTIHGEPLLTAQAFYYLEQLESVAEIRFEDGHCNLSDQELEYLIDNYLYEFSKMNGKSKISTKVIGGKYWAYDESDMYNYYDQMNTKALILDQANDKSIQSIEEIDSDGNISFNNWCIVKNYSDDIFDLYLDAMSKLINKKVLVSVFPTDERDGYIGKARLVKCNSGLVDSYQAQRIDDIMITDIKSDSLDLPIRSNITGVPIYSIPISRVSLEKYYNPILLSFYFSGLKEYNPLLAFTGFYNVIEYYFEEAPILLGKKVKAESDQIRCVIELLVDNQGISKLISGMNSGVSKSMHQNMETSSTIAITGFAPTTENDNINELGRWLYEIRCAIVHSKKTRNGKVTAIFEPYSSQTENIKTAVPIIKWLAILCIEKDFDLGGSKVPYRV